MMDSNASVISRRKPIFVVVMGVCGSGKTTVGLAVAKKLNLTFEDADTLHPESNIKKMKSGIPLNDSDRLEWLQTISERMSVSEVNDQGLVIGCSALKIKYRRILRGFSYDYFPDTKPPGSRSDIQRHVHFLFLKGSYSELMTRIQGRHDHFMPASLLQSQFDALEEPTEDEGIDSRGQIAGKLFVTAIDSSPEQIASKFVDALNFS